ncbi:M23 family metallopeptidase [Dokdonella sp.]|uniref:M23 family metallopeptidase n=1 Tax=Dokdonella sp. TaxID=2291710 RepID=UPI002F41AB6A
MHRGFRRSRRKAGTLAAFLATTTARIATLLPATLVLAHAAAASPFPDQVSQGALVRATVNPHAKVRVAGHVLRVGPRGEIVFGVGRDERGPVTIDITERDGQRERIAIPVVPRDWPVERIEGVPPKTVEPPPEIAERIKREQARVVAARERDDAREDYMQAFAWPVDGRISGRFGNQRIYVVDGRDVPKSPHSGMDIAVPEGTPVKAPAAGVVTFADPGLYLTGGTVLIDHGHGVSSNFLHLSRIDVKLGQRVAQGDVIGAAGMTGRATGPHLHWGMNWFDVRVDPLLLLNP